MRGQPIRVLELCGSPAQIGTAHGAAHADAIRRFAADRLCRSADGTDLSRPELLALAESCLASHQRYAPDLVDEMVALARAAAISPAEALIVGGYTDFIDTVRAHARRGPVEDNCTAALVPDGLAGGAGFLAQTWDMHASATEHVVLLRLRPAQGPAALVFTTVGCLGQIGMNEAGVVIGINNLTAADGRPGVTWPFVVRKALQQTDGAAALDTIVDADLAGGHNFLVLDRSGAGWCVEAMPTVRDVVALSSSALVHTNHCLAAATIAVEGARPAALQAASLTRLEHARALLARGTIGLEDLVALTRDERSICRHVEPPFDYESCGAIIMRPASLEMWACWGVPSQNDYERFTLSQPFRTAPAARP